MSQKCLFEKYTSSTPEITEYSKINPLTMEVTTSQQRKSFFSITTSAEKTELMPETIAANKFADLQIPNLAKDIEELRRLPSGLINQVIEQIDVGVFPAADLVFQHIRPGVGYICSPKFQLEEIADNVNTLAHQIDAKSYSTALTNLHALIGSIRSLTISHQMSMAMSEELDLLGDSISAFTSRIYESFKTDQPEASLERLRIKDYLRGVEGSLRDFSQVKNEEPDIRE